MVKQPLTDLTINQLCELTGRTFRTVKDRLKNLEPSWQDGRALAYDPQKALPLIYDVGKKEKEGVLDLQTERARLAAAQADKTEIERDLLLKKVVKVEEIESAWVSLFANARAKALNMPSKLAPRLTGKKNPAEIESIIRASVYEMLLEMSEYDPSQFDSAAGQEGGGNNEASAPADDQPVG